MNAFEVDEYGVIEFAEGIKSMPVCADKRNGLFSLRYNKGEGDADGRKRIKANMVTQYLYHVYSWNSQYAEIVNLDERISQVLKLLELDKDFIEEHKEKIDILAKEITDIQERMVTWKSVKTGKEVLVQIQEQAMETNDMKLKMEYLKSLEEMNEKLESIEKKFREKLKMDNIAYGGEEISDWES